MLTEAGGGLQFWINDAIGVRVEARNLMWLPKDDLTKPVSNGHTEVAGDLAPSPAAGK